MADPPTGETLRGAHALRGATTRLARRLRRLRADHGVTAATLSVLGHLYRADRGLAAVELARLEGLQPQSLTRIIADLDEKGLVARSPDPADRRQILINIAPAGSALLMRDARQQAAWLAQAMQAELTGTEQALLHLATGLMERLAACALSQEASAPEDG